MKDVLYHAKVGEGAFENNHELKTIVQKLYNFLLGLQFLKKWVPFLA
jgi:hypothetical protein